MGDPTVRRLSIAVLYVVLSIIIVAVLNTSAHGSLISSEADIERGIDCAVDNQVASELMTFFSEISTEFERYHVEKGHYPSEWWQLEIFYTAMPYRTSEVEQYYPTRDMKERWNPAGCVYTYIIAESGEDNYLIMTENEYGFQNYQFKKGDVPNYAYAKFWITQEGE